MSGRYTFGDDDLAASRLALLAEVFEPSTRALLAATVPTGARRIVDLGCGPGHTTRLLADACRPERVLGIDRSEAFVARARQGTEAANIDFAVGDATADPLPGTPAEVIYARFLLAHLPNPAAVFRHWCAALAPGGVLVVEEVEDIEAPPGVLTTYLELVSRLVGTEGATMRAGAVLQGLGGGTVGVPVDAARAAGLFGRNLAVWRADALRKGLMSARELDELAAALASVARAPTGGVVRWTLRQLVGDRSMAHT